MWPNVLERKTIGLRAIRRRVCLRMPAPVLALALASTAVAQTPLRVVTLDQDIRSRDDTLTVSITNGPASAASSTIKLSRNGSVYELPAVYAPPAAGASAGIVTTALTGPDSSLPLGKYQVVAELDGRPYPVPAAKKLEIVPPGNPELSLAPLNPPATDRTEDLFLKPINPSPTDPIKPIKSVALELHGTGFQTGDAAKDNAILINRSPQDVKWRSCATALLGDSNEGVAREFVAEAVSATTLRLCHVPVPRNGEIQVQIVVGDRESDPQNFLVYRLNTLWAAVIAAVIAVALASVPVALLHALVHGYRISERVELKKKLLFLDPETDTYSLSKLQFYLWTVAALFSYSYLLISRVFVQNATWPDVPGNLPGIIAIAAGTTVGAQVITSAKGSKGAGAPEPSLADFITSGGVVAADRVQMLLWTLYGVGAFIFASVATAPGIIIALPSIPDNLLYLMGLSSLGYLGGKMARKAGPVINEISVTPSDPDDVIAVAGGGAPERPDLMPAVLDARAVLARFPTPANTAAAAVAALQRAVDQAAAAQTTADLNGLVQNLVTERAKAGEEARNVANAYAAEADPAKQSALAADAAVAQQAAAALQELSAQVTQIIAVAAASPMIAMDAPQTITRTITLRGTNLSPEALLELDKVELPFRMLLNAEGKHEPDVVAREESSPTFARRLRLTIEPSGLNGADLLQFHKWFASTGQHTLTFTNPDGQRAELPFTLPPGVGQK